MHDKTQGPTAHHRQAHDMLIDSPLLLKGGRGKATHKKISARKLSAKRSARERMQLTFPHFFFSQNCIDCGHRC